MFINAMTRKEKFTLVAAQLSVYAVCQCHVLKATRKAEAQQKKAT